MTTSVVIPTYDRLDDLRLCLASLARQTIPPDEIIVVDDGETAEEEVRRCLDGSGIHLVYHQKKGMRGQHVSRNEGVELAGGEIIFFFDDDTVLEPEYIEATLAVYAGDSAQRIGGMGGVITNWPGGLRQAVANVLRGMPPFGHGRVLASGANLVGYSSVHDIQRVEWLAGGVCSYRCAVFDKHRFCEDVAEYSFLEDVEFSYRVAQEYELYITPHARLAHNVSPRGRVDWEEYGFREIANLRRHFARAMPQRLRNRLALHWYVAGTMLIDLGRLLTQPHRWGRNWRRLRGHLRAALTPDAVLVEVHRERSSGDQRTAHEHFPHSVPNGKGSDR